MELRLHGRGLSRRGGARLPSFARHGLGLPLGIAALMTAVPLVMLLGTVVAFGWQLQVVETGSMAPLFPQGSLAVVQPLDPSEVRQGMPIVFRDRIKGELVVHRVVGREPHKLATWRTKGDANATEDPLPVEARDVRGRVRWAVPHLGQVGQWLRGDRAPWVLVGTPLVLLVLSEVTTVARRRSRASTVVPGLPAAASLSPTGWPPSEVVHAPPLSPRPR